ncbi:protein transport Sec1b-like [Eutrema salsugineum]|uniref:protein transport Sec1b-like n=1 Tax=Eutrema salsugineum TaxID=72664 RepID=UPI000CED294D|nr:protein transport Sec1b-like [Eutrema salsugineum]
MVHALPQYSEQIDKLSLHVEIARTINRTIMEQGLRELGQLEQDLVFGDAGRKDVIKFLTTNNVINQESKLRLMMIVAAIYPKKFEGEKGRKMMEKRRCYSGVFRAEDLKSYGGSWWIEDRETCWRSLLVKK